MANFSFTKVSNTSGPYSVFRNPSINDVGTVVFEAFIAVDTPPTGILTGSGGSTTTIAEGSAPIDVVFNPSINKAETTAYAGVGYTYFNSDPSINKLGTVAFEAELDAGGSGIFIGPDPIVDKVIVVGDSLFGSTVTELFISQKGLNDAGQLAFQATLADGNRAVFRADPRPVPESSSVELFSVAAIVLIGCHWRGQMMRTRRSR